MYVYSDHDSGDNPYLRLLRTPLAIHNVVTDELPTTVTAAWLKRHANRNVVLHFHWPSHWYHPLRSSATVQNDMKLLLDRFAEVLRTARALGCGVVWTVHNLYPHDLVDQQLDRYAREVIVRYATGIIVHTAPAMERVKSEFVPVVPPRVIPHGNYVGVYGPMPSKSEARDALGLSRDGIIFLCFGKIRAYKGHHGLLSAFRKLAMGNARLIIAGKSREPETRQRLAREASLDRRILVFDRHVDDEEVGKFFAACDMVVLPYTNVTTSGTVMLAKSMARPVIAPAIPSMQDMLSSHEGILYDPADADALEKSMSSAAEVDVDEMGQYALRAAQDVSWEDIAKRTLFVYEQALMQGESLALGDDPELWCEGVPSLQNGNAAMQRIDNFLHETFAPRFRDTCRARRKSFAVELTVSVPHGSKTWVIDSLDGVVAQPGKATPALTIRVPVDSLDKVLMGQVSWHAVRKAGHIEVIGHRSNWRDLVKFIPGWERAFAI